MPTLRDYSIHQAVERDGLPRVADYDDGSQQVLYRNGSGVVQSMEAADWLAQRGALPVDPTQQESDAAIAALHAATQQAQTDAAQLRQQLQTLAQSAVGVRVPDLTTNQLKAMLAILLWKDGGLKPDLTIRPLADWIDRR